MLIRSIPRLKRTSLAALLAVCTITSPVLATDEVVVQRGDTLWGIARRHGTTVAELVRLNHLADPRRIYAGQRIVLEAPAPAAAPAVPAAAPAPVLHTVRAGENLTRIARRYGVTIGAVVAANRLVNPSFIRAGQRLTIPIAAPAASATPPAAAPAAAARTHTVTGGENLTGIARRYATTVGALVAANHLSNPSYIRAGQRLVIPGGSPAVVAAPAPSMPASMRALVSRRAGVGAVIDEMAARYGVSAAFARAVAWQESGWQQNITSHAGAMGVMQLMPGTADWVGGAMLGRAVDPRNLRQNVDAGVRLLRYYLDRYHGDKARVLAAYYQGQRAVDRHGIYAVSRPYIASILVLERIFAGG